MLKQLLFSILLFYTLSFRLFLTFQSAGFSQIHEIACSPDCTVVLGTWNKKRKIEEILRENKGERRVVLRSEEKDPSCESNAFIGLDGYSGTRGIEDGGEWAENEATRRSGGLESKSRSWAKRWETKNRLSLWKCRRSIVRQGTRFLPLSGIQLASPVPDENVNPSKDGMSTYATSQDLSIFGAPFFRCSRKNNGDRVIGTASSWFDIRINVAMVGSRKI